MFELRMLSEDERSEYDRIVYAATHDTNGQSYPTREFGARFLAELRAALATGRDWPQWLIDDMAEDGLKQRAKAWLKQSEFIEVSRGESAVVRKSARMGVLRRAEGSDVVAYQQILWPDLTTDELRQIVEASVKRRAAEGDTITAARRLLGLCEKHFATRVSDALNREGVTLDEFLQGAA